jgi:hypothetical protein
MGLRTYAAHAHLLRPRFSLKGRARVGDWHGWGGVAGGRGGRWGMGERGSEEKEADFTKALPDNGAQFLASLLSSGFTPLRTRQKVKPTLVCALVCIRAKGYS